MPLLSVAGYLHTDSAKRILAGLTPAAMSTLRYFKRGYDRDPNAFWIDHDQSARSRVPGLLRRGLIERNPTPGIADLYRITEAGRQVVERGQ